MVIDEENARTDYLTMNSLRTKFTVNKNECLKVLKAPLGLVASASAGHSPNFSEDLEKLLRGRSRLSAFHDIS